MTIPNVVMRWCKKKAKCRWCEEDIELANPMVAVVFRNKMVESNRSWNTYLYYHPDCWVKQGLDYLNRNPYVEQRRRSRTLLLSEEDRIHRRKLITNYHS